MLETIIFDAPPPAPQPFEPVVPLYPSLPTLTFAPALGLALAHCLMSDYTFQWCTFVVDPVKGLIHESGTVIDWCVTYGHDRIEVQLPNGEWTTLCKFEDEEFVPDERIEPDAVWRIIKGGSQRPQEDP